MVISVAFLAETTSAEAVKQKPPIKKAKTATVIILFFIF
jgi:hypothetical protein